MDQENEDLTVKQAAAILKVTPRTVQRLIKRGDLRAMRIGRGKRAPWRIRRSDLDKVYQYNIESEKMSEDNAR